LPGEVVLAVFDTFWPNIGQSGGGAALNTVTVVANAMPKIHLRAGAIVPALRRLIDLNGEIVNSFGLTLLCLMKWPRFASTRPCHREELRAEGVGSFRNRYLMQATAKSNPT